MPNNDHDKNQTGTSLIKAAIKNVRTHTHSCLHTCICLYRIIQIYGGGRQKFNKKQKMIIKTSFSTTTNQNKNHCNHTCSSAIHNNGCSWCTPAAGSCRNFVWIIKKKYRYRYNTYMRKHKQLRKLCMIEQLRFCCYPLQLPRQM